MSNSNPIHFTYSQPYTNKVNTYRYNNSSLKKPLNLHTNQSFSTIDPSWHIIASLQTIFTKKTHKQQQIGLRNMMEYSKNLQVAFMNHCAVLIQKNYKGYLQRKYYKRFLPIYRRVKSLLEATAMGWKIRRIMKLRVISKKIKQIKQLENTGQQKKLRIMKRDLNYQIKELSKKGKWIQKIQSQNKQISKVPYKRTINLKVALSNAPKKDNYKSLQSTRFKQSPYCSIKQQQSAVNISQYHNIQSNIIENQQLEKPLITKGFYQLPQNQQIGNNSLKNNQNKKTHKTQNKTIKDIKKNKHRNNKKVSSIDNNEPSRNICQKSDKSEVQKFPINTTLTNNHKLTKQNRTIDDISHLSIHLPVQEQFLSSNQQFINKFGSLKNSKIIELQNKNSKIIEFQNKTSSQQIKIHNIERSKQSKPNKGLKVTLLDKNKNTKLEPKCQNKQMIQINKDGSDFNLQIKAREQNWNPLQFNISQKQLDKYGPETTMRQLLQAYNGPYYQKKLEIYNKLQKIHSEKKFRGGK